MSFGLKDITPEMQAAKKELWERYFDIIWGVGIGLGPVGSTGIHIRLYVRDEAARERILKETPTYKGLPVHAEVTGQPIANAVCCKSVDPKDYPPSWRPSGGLATGEEAPQITEDDLRKVAEFESREIRGKYGLDRFASPLPGDPGA